MYAESRGGTIPTLGNCCPSESDVLPGRECNSVDLRNLICRLALKWRAVAGLPGPDLLSFPEKLVEWRLGRLGLGVRVL